MAQLDQNLIPIKREKPFVCVADRCNQEEHLKQDLSFLTENKPSIPEVLESEFSQTLISKKDPNTLLLELPFECKIYPIGVNCEDNLIHCLDVQRRWKSFVCEICQKTFSGKRHLNDHFRVHTGEKPFLCEICQKAFNFRNSLMAHLRTHAREKPFVCEICLKIFPLKGTLNYHPCIHTRENLFVCEICQKGFVEKANLNMHRLVCGAH